MSNELTFRDWCGDEDNYHRDDEVGELCRCVVGFPDSPLTDEEFLEFVVLEFVFRECGEGGIKTVVRAWMDYCRARWWKVA